MRVRSLLVLSVLLGGCGGGSIDGDEASPVSGTTTSAGGAGSTTSAGGAGSKTSAGGAGGAGGATTTSAGGSFAAPLLDFFPIGVFSQPVHLMDAWKARGVDTMVQYESEGGTVDLATWSAEATKRGLHMIRKPGADLAADAANPLLLAFAQPDEPDIKQGDLPPASLAADYAAWKKAAPSVPVWLNFSGFDVLQTGAGDTACNGPGDGGDEACFPSYIATADWIANDLYPVAGMSSTDLSLVGKAIDKLAGWSAGRPQFAFVETSDQHAPWLGANARGPRADEVRAEIWDAVVHGARGVFYFPDQPFDGFQYDATPPDVATEITAQNALLHELGALLERPVDPTEGRVTKVSVDAPLEAGWRDGPEGAVVIVVNLSADPQPARTVKLEGPALPATGTALHEGRDVAIAGGAFTDDFAGHAVHVIRIE
jgi:hypothetical protein